MTLWLVTYLLHNLHKQKNFYGTGFYDTGFFSIKKLPYIFCKKKIILKPQQSFHTRKKNQPPTPKT